MRFAHTNIVARDWKKLSKFYINVFNCTEKPPKRELSGDWLDKATGLKKAELEGIHLVVPGYGKNGPTLEIFTYKDLHESGSVMPNHTGFSHIAFEVENVAETLKKALENGGIALGEIVEKKIENAGLLKFVYFKDPEENIIEIQSWEK